MRLKTQNGRRKNLERFILKVVKTFEHVQNVHQGDRIAIVAPGPELNQLHSLDDFGAAVFVGDAHRRTGLRADKNYYVRANTEFPRMDRASDYEDLLLEDFQLLVASSIMESEVPVHELIERLPSESTALVFDQRHFAGISCSPLAKCCESKVSPTIQEKLRDHVGWTHHYSGGASVFVHALAITLLFGPKEIVIYGVGLPLKKSQYTYHSSSNVSSQLPQPIGGKLLLSKVTAALRSPRWLRFYLARIVLGEDSPSIFAEDFVSLISDLQYLADASAALGIRLVNASKTSTLNVLPGYFPSGQAEDPNVPG